QYCAVGNRRGRFPERPAAAHRAADTDTTSLLCRRVSRRQPGLALGTPEILSPPRVGFHRGLDLGGHHAEVAVCGPRHAPRIPSPRLQHSYHHLAHPGNRRTPPQSSAEKFCNTGQTITAHTIRTQICTYASRVISSPRATLLRALADGW